MAGQQVEYTKFGQIIVDTLTDSHTQTEKYQS